MTGGNAVDPFAMFREALNQWEKAANEMGTRLLSSPEAVEFMHKGNAASMQAQNAIKDAMARSLAAANLPSKADIDALSAQIGAIEARLARIESHVTGAPHVAAAAPPRPKRTRKPPSS